MTGPPLAEGARASERRGRRRASEPIATPAFAPDLARELGGPAWEHPWSLAPGITAPTRDPGARHAAWTLEAMLEEPVRDAVAMAGDRPEGLVLGAGEGRLAHRLLEWGLARVVAVDGRPSAARRAELVRDHFAIAPYRLDVRHGPEGEALDPSRLGQFAVVAVDVARAVGDIPSLLAVARHCSLDLCAIVARDADRASLVAALDGAELGSVERAQPPLEAERPYVLGARFVLLAHPPPAA